MDVEWWCAGSGQGPARTSWGVLDGDADRGQPVADLVGRGVVLACAGRLPLIERHGNEAVHDVAQARRVTATAGVGPRFGQRVQAQHAEHRTHFAEPGLGALLVARGESRVAGTHGLVQYGDGSRHTEVV